jgi:hypothetical protein
MWPIINDEVAYKKLIGCMKISELKQLGKLLYEVRCKWGNKLKI